MAVTDYNRKKNIEVTSQNDSGTTQDKAQPILLSDGDDSTTGTGDIIIDFTNVSSDSDIAVYDQNGNLLPYEIENRTSTGAVLWVYNSWTRDDSVQAQVVYGDGPDTAEDVVEGVWNNTGQNAVIVQHLQDDPLTATDSTANNNDGTVNGAVSTSGQFDGAGGFDGTDDYIDIPNSSSLNITSDITVASWIKWDGGRDTDNKYFVAKFNTEGSSQYLAWINGDELFNFLINDGSGNITAGTSSISASSGTFYNHVGRLDTSNDEISSFVDAVKESLTNTASTPQSTTENLAIGSETGGSGAGNWFSGNIDAVRIFSDSKSDSWIQAEFDASPKAGQVYFSQQAAETTTTTISTSTANATGTDGGVLYLNNTTIETPGAAQSKSQEGTFDIKEDFEDNDIDGWSGNTKYFSTESFSYMPGNYSGYLLVTQDDQLDPGGTATVEKDIRASSSASFAIALEENTGGFRIYGPGGEIGFLQLSSSDITWNGTTVQSSFSYQTRYDVRLIIEGSDEVRIKINGADKGVYSMTNISTTITKIEVQTTDEYAV